MVGWSLLTDFDAIKRAGVPILRSLNIRFRLKQQARERGTISLGIPLLTALLLQLAGIALASGCRPCCFN